MTPAPELLTIDVDGAELGVIRWRGAPGAPVVFAVHGLTGNAWAWAAVAHHLDGEIGLVGLDLRGRGTSCHAPPPYGIRRHADDLAAVVEQLSAAPAIVVGHSMGASVALAAADRHPGVVSEVVLVDGGPLDPPPDDADPQELLDAAVGPAIARLRTVWPDRVAYHTMWSEHPAFAGELTPEVERYLLSDLEPCPGGFRSIVVEAAVRLDGGELIADPEIRSLFERRAQPATVLRAETGLMGAPPPFIAADWLDRASHHDWRTVPGTNHYSIVLGDVGAAAIAHALRDVVAATV